MLLCLLFSYYFEWSVKNLELDVDSVEFLKPDQRATIPIAKYLVSQYFSFVFNFSCIAL